VHLVVTSCQFNKLKTLTRLPFNAKVNHDAHSNKRISAHTSIVFIVRSWGRPACCFVTTCQGRRDRQGTQDKAG